MNEEQIRDEDRKAANRSQFKSNHIYDHKSYEDGFYEGMNNSEQNPQSCQTDVIGSPSFEDWLNKYFETPKMKMMYKRKDGKGEYDREKLIRDYKRAYRQS